MIATENLVTTVKFGNEQKGNIAVGVKCTILTLQQLVKEMPIGEQWSEEDIDKLPKIEMEFFNENSVDVVIKALELIKNNILVDQANYILKNILVNDKVD